MPELPGLPLPKPPSIPKPPVIPKPPLVEIPPEPPLLPGAGPGKPHDSGLSDLLDLVNQVLPSR
jgi:hypothetical protein